MSWLLFKSIHKSSFEDYGLKNRGFSLFQYKIPISQGGPYFKKIISFRRLEGGGNLAVWSSFWSMIMIIGLGSGMFVIIFAFVDNFLSNRGKFCRRLCPSLSLCQKTVEGRFNVIWQNLGEVTGGQLWVWFFSIQKTRIRKTLWWNISHFDFPFVTFFFCSKAIKTKLCYILLFLWNYLYQLLLLVQCNIPYFL